MDTEQQPQVGNGILIILFGVGLFADVLKGIIILIGVGLILNSIISACVATFFWFLLKSEGVKAPIKTLNGITEGSHRVAAVL